MTPPICGRMVTLEIGVTWPTGGGSISTGKLVSPALATSTGTGAAVLVGLLREQPFTRISAAKTAGMKRSFFTTDLFPGPAAGFESRRKFPQKPAVVSLKFGVVNGFARGQPDQLRKRRRKNRQRLHGQSQMRRGKGGRQQP